MWATNTAVGVPGGFLLRKRLLAAGLALVAGYAALGFDGLEHCALAPMALHTLVAKVTILSGVATAAFLLAMTMYLLTRQRLQRGRHRAA